MNHDKKINKGRYGDAHATIPALERLRQEDEESKASLHYKFKA